jgi:exodeoxyribonuclease V beta subunit
MQRFDCLSPKHALQGPHLLEASAGTGKTFAVEQIFVRLLLESDIEIEQIIAVTFTRAATRELKERIRSNLEKAIKQLQSGEIDWAYLIPFQGQPSRLRQLQAALNSFDRSQIFTIHGFCHRMLSEFAFEAGLPFSSPALDKNCIQIPEKLKQGAIDFLSAITEEILCVEQLDALVKKYKNIEKLLRALLKMSMKEAVSPPVSSFSALYQTYVSMMSSWSLSSEKLLKDFTALSKNYKGQGKGQFEKQLQVLGEPPTKEGFRFLLSEKMSIFEFLSPANQKLKAVSLSVDSDVFFDWGRVSLLPLLKLAAHPKNSFAVLVQEWGLCAKRLMQENELFDPDAILKKMRDTLQSAPFAERVKGKYRAAIVDEFQDTDLLQWEIFHILFLKKEDVFSHKPVFLVGDPKQSIYRFRKADIYTYLQAKETLGSSCHYFLDTNFRSSKPLIEALNTLFDREWLFLPKLNKTLPFIPVLSGAKGVEAFADEKGSIHFFISEESEGDKKFDDLLQTMFLPFITNEILRLRSETGSLNRFAVLVKDRYQASQAVDYLEQRGLAALTKSHMPLGETFAFKTLREALDALMNVQDRKKTRLVLAGPFGRMSAEELPCDVPPLFFELKSVLEERGLAVFFQRFLQSTLHQIPLLEAIAMQEASFYRDFFHTVELLLEWERTEGFSSVGLRRVLEEFSLLEAEEDDRVRRRMESDDEAIQVMTMHVSKGLEFDVVFALGLASRTPKPEEEPEELEVEKLRQLYVAMTRAKRRLYIPVALAPPEENLDGTASPIELFLNIFKKEKTLEYALEQAASQASISWEKLRPMQGRDAERLFVNTFAPLPPLLYEIIPSYLHSFTSLASKEEGQFCFSEPSEELTVHTLPRGTEVGIVLHQLFENIFSFPNPIWKKIPELILFIEQELKNSPFYSWKEVICSLIVQTVSLPFLSILEPQDVQTEVEFIFESPPHFIKGFIDLIFRQGNQFYLVDWKSNWLGKQDDAYSHSALQQSMKSQDYELQAAIYAEALKRSFHNLEFGGAYYVFLRGLASTETQGVLFFQPRKGYALLA